MIPTPAFSFGALLAAAAVLCLLAAPILAVVFAWSVRRDMGRIADAIEQNIALTRVLSVPIGQESPVHASPSQSTIVPSAFGR